MGKISNKPSMKQYKLMIMIRSQGLCVEGSNLNRTDGHDCAIYRIYSRLECSARCARLAL